MKKIYFGGGCFWCTEAIFQRVIGVKSNTRLYGRKTENPSYKEICTGERGMQKLLRFGMMIKLLILKLFYLFFNTHDPTTKNRQGNDIGTQYRVNNYM